MNLPAHWSTDLPLLAEAWRGVSSEVAGLATARGSAKIDRWKEALGELIAKRAMLVERGEWHRHGPGDLLSLAGFGRTELAHTAVLGWLCSSAREHGLGSAFLDGVLVEVGLEPVPPADRKLVRVTTEETRAHRRADVIVRFPGCTLVIEAKVDADESPDQCDDLFTLFADEPDVQFVFLTPSGRKPTTASGEAAEAFVALSFHQVRALLAGLVAAPSVAEARGASAVRSYFHTLEAQFPERQPMNIDARLRFYFENKRILDEWAALSVDAKTAANDFFCTLVEPVRALGANLGPDVRVHAHVDSAHPKILLLRESWQGENGGIRVGIGLEWNKGSAAFDKSYTGVWVHRGAMEASAPLHARICKELDAEGLPRESRTAWWPKWSYEPTPPGEWWLDLDALRTHLVDRIAARWEAMAECVDDALPEGT